MLLKNEILKKFWESLEKIWKNGRIEFGKNSGLLKKFWVFFFLINCGLVKKETFLDPENQVRAEENLKKWKRDFREVYLKKIWKESRYMSLIEFRKIKNSVKLTKA